MENRNRRRRESRHFYKDHAFPQHFFERITRRLHSRHRKPRRFVAPIRTWYRCYKNNRDKLLYRFHYRFIKRNRRQAETQWDAVIWFQKRRIARKHDIVLHWAMTEYRTLKKMNEGLPDPFQSLVWRFVVAIQVSKTNHEHRHRPARLTRERLHWNTCVRRFVDRRNVSRVVPDLWDLSARANIKKAISLNRVSTWNAAAYEQWKRLRRSVRLS